MKMWFSGGAVMVVCGALLAAAQPRLSQLVDDADDSSDATYECYARYMRTPQEHGVLLVHDNQPHVARYVASVRSPLTILNAPSDYIWALSSLLDRAYERPYGLLVLLLATPKDARHFESVLVSLAQHRRGTRVLVMVTEAPGADLHAIFVMATNACAPNVAVLVAGNNTRAYTHFPFGGGACSDRQTPEALGPCQRLQLDQLYPNKEPRQFNGCVVRLAVDAPPPAVIDPASDSEQPLVAGFELALANIIIRRLNLTAIKLTSWEPCKTPNPYYRDAARWYVPVPPPRAQWKNIVWLFQAPLWLTILAFFLLNTLAWWLAGAGGYAECVLGSLLTLLNGAVPLPRRTTLRFLVVAWTLCTLVLVAAYQSQLLSTLLTPVAEQQPISTERELLASGVPVLFESNNLVKKRPDWYEIYKYSHKTNRSKGPRAELNYGITARYRTREHTDAHGKPTLVPIEEVTLYGALCVRFDYRISTLPTIDRLMARLVEAGLLAKFMRDVDFSQFWTPGEREDEPLTMRHLDFVFFALLLGCALASLTLLLEVVWWRLQHGWWRALCTAARRCGSRIRDCWRTCITSVQRCFRARVRRWRRVFRRRLLVELNQ